MSVKVSALAVVLHLHLSARIRMTTYSTNGQYHR